MTRTATARTLFGTLLGALFGALLAALLAAACGGGEPERPDALPVPGLAAFTIGVDLWLREDGEERLIVEADEGRQVLSPALSPDGDRIAFVFFQVTSGEQNGRMLTVGADLAVWDADGGVQIVLEHGERSEYFWNPRWTPDGQSLIYTHEAPGMEIAVERLDLVSGETRLLRPLARDGDVAPDGRRLVFIDDPYGGAPRLMVRDLQSGAEHPLDAQNDWEIYVFRIPKWTPDGQSIVFAGATQLPTVSGNPLLAALNNGPEDIWRVAGAGGQPELIAAVTEDQPDFALSDDGRHVLIRGSFGVYIAAIPAGGAPFAVAPGEFHGWHDWRGRLTDAQWRELVDRAAAGAQ